MILVVLWGDLMADDIENPSEKWNNNSKQYNIGEPLSPYVLCNKFLDRTSKWYGDENNERPDHDI